VYPVIPAKLSFQLTRQIEQKACNCETTISVTCWY